MLEIYMLTLKIIVKCKIFAFRREEVSDYMDPFPFLLGGFTGRYVGNDCVKLGGRGHVCSGY